HRTSSYAPSVPPEPPDPMGPAYNYESERSRGSGLEFVHELLQRHQPCLKLRPPSVGFYLFENRRRQKLAIRAFNHRRRLLELAFQSLGGGHELRHDLGERVARHVVLAGEERLPQRATDDPFDVGPRQLTALGDRRDVLRRQLRSELPGKNDEHLPDFVLVGGIEERNVHFRTALPLEI